MNTINNTTTTAATIMMTMMGATITPTLVELLELEVADDTGVVVVDDIGMMVVDEGVTLIDSDSDEETAAEFATTDVVSISSTAPMKQMNRCKI